MPLCVAGAHTVTTVEDFFFYRVAAFGWGHRPCNRKPALDTFAQAARVLRGMQK